MKSKVRVRFAPSPTGALHIGGVRTALYNYLFAKKLGGSFILRIEDTDQNRFVPGAEEYIMQSLQWLGLSLDEGIAEGGDFGPYRQSDRKEMYAQFAEQLVSEGKAYYAFDTTQELESLRKKFESEGKTFKYDASTRLELNNSLTKPKEFTEAQVQSGNYVVRILLPADEKIIFQDLIRGEVVYNTNDMDDKVMLKGNDQMPTYHLANVVDDYHMKISHVIRGEEWLPSTPLHVILYNYLGWKNQMPAFAHLPLILKPDGKGKLSKRDGAAFGMPVFPMEFTDVTKANEKVLGFKEWGFEPKAVLNFLALLGWHPSNDQEIFSLTDLIESFDISKVSKSGARFDFDKAKWFNQQYIQQMSNSDLVNALKPFVVEKFQVDPRLDMSKIAELMRDRLIFTKDILSSAYLFEKPDYSQILQLELSDFNKKVILHWGDQKINQVNALLQKLGNIDFVENEIKLTMEDFCKENQLKLGEFFPILRFALSATLKGPNLFPLMEILGKESFTDRLKLFIIFCNNEHSKNNISN